MNLTLINVDKQIFSDKYHSYDYVFLFDDNLKYELLNIYQHVMKIHKIHICKVCLYDRHYEILSNDYVIHNKQHSWNEKLNYLNFVVLFE